MRPPGRSAGRRVAEEVDGIADRGGGREQVAQRARVRAAARAAEAGGVAGIRAEDRRPARVRDDGRPGAPGQRLGGEQRGDVQELAERVGADHARVTEERVGRAVRLRDQRARRRRAAVAPAADAPALTATIGLASATRRAIRAKLRGLPKDSR